MVYQNNGLSEGIEGTGAVVNMKSTDKQLLKVSNMWQKDAQSLYNIMKTIWEKNKKYYLGEQVNEKLLGDYQSKIVDNKIFQNLETIIPIASANLPVPVATLPVSSKGGENIDSRTYASNLEEIILAIGQDNKLPFQLEEMVREHQLSHLGVMKCGVEYEEDKSPKRIWIRSIDPERIMLPDNMDDDYIIEHHIETFEKMRDHFKDIDPELEAVINGLKKDDKLGKDVKDDMKIGYFEFTTPKMKWWKCGKVIIHKMDNPHYDFKAVSKNHWCEPLTEYVLTDIWTMKKNRYAQTTLVSQTIKVQDAINKRKRQISDNADHSNGKLVAYGDSGITKAQVAELEASNKKPNTPIFLKGVQVGGVTHFNGMPLQSFVMDDMLHTISEMDNIWGTHSNLRGEKTPGEVTFGGQQLLKGADESRIGTIGKMLDRMAEQIYNMVAQMIVVHFDKESYIPYLGPDGTSKQVKIQAKLIKDGTRISVRQGTSLAKDRVAQAKDAIVLWQNGAIDPVSLYEKLGDPNPYKAAERLYKWLKAPDALFQEVANEIKDSTKTDYEEDIDRSVARAAVENGFMMQGKRVPPYKDATVQHIAAHEEMMHSPQFAQLTPEAQQMVLDHVRAETELVKGYEADKQAIAKEENNVAMSKKLDNLNK